MVLVSSGDGAYNGANSYDEYGIPGTANVGRFQYTGQIRIKSTDFYHYEPRAYSPTFGRFLQAYPIGYGDGLNWYAYVGNDPINATDPSEFAVEVICKVDGVRTECPQQPAQDGGGRQDILGREPADG